MTKYHSLLKRIGHTFKNSKFLEEALTHPSCLGDDSLSVKKSYERLEFLGDAVLSFIIAEFLIKNFPEETEGNLTKRRAALVNSKMISFIGKEINILKYLTTSGGEKFNESDAAKALEDVTEALLGAIYLDGGMRNCKKFVMKHWESFLFKELVPDDDSKTYLQEWSQKRGFGIPEYKLVSKSGAAHAPIFTIEVKVSDLPTFTAKSASKKLAEKEAAKALIEYIKST